MVSLRLGIILFYCVLKMTFEAMTTSAVMDVPTDEQELPEPVMALTVLIHMYA